MTGMSDVIPKRVTPGSEPEKGEETVKDESEEEDVKVRNLVDIT